jgi:hypothetical protein
MAADAALQAKVEALGCKVQKTKLKNACGELYTLDRKGNRAELFVDPSDGQIAGQLKRSGMSAVNGEIEAAGATPPFRSNAFQSDDYRRTPQIGIR